jgi:hypothetical protein
MGVLPMAAFIKISTMGETPMIQLDCPERVKTAST